MADLSSMLLCSSHQIVKVYSQNGSVVKNIETSEPVLSASFNKKANGILHVSKRHFSFEAVSPNSQPTRVPSQSLACARFSSDCKLTLLTSSHSGALYVYDNKTFKYLPEVPVHGDRIATLATSFHSNLVMTGSASGSLALLTARDKDRKVLPLSKISNLSNPGVVKRALTVGSTERSTWVAAGANDGRLGVWDVQSNKPLCDEVISSASIRGVGFLTGQGGFTVAAQSEDGTLLIKDLRISGNSIIQHAPGRASCLALRDDGGRIAVGGSEGQVYTIGTSDFLRGVPSWTMWDMGTQKPLSDIQFQPFCGSPAQASSSSSISAAAASQIPSSTMASSRATAAVTTPSSNSLSSTVTGEAGGASGRRGDEGGRREDGGVVKGPPLVPRREEEVMQSSQPSQPYESQPLPPPKEKTVAIENHSRNADESSNNNIITIKNIVNNNNNNNSNSNSNSSNLNPYPVRSNPLLKGPSTNSSDIQSIPTSHPLPFPASNASSAGPMAAAGGGGRLSIKMPDGLNFNPGLLSSGALTGSSTYSSTSNLNYNLNSSGPLSGGSTTGSHVGLGLGSTATAVGVDREGVTNRGTATMLVEERASDDREDDTPMANNPINTHSAPSSNLPSSSNSNAVAMPPSLPSSQSKSAAPQIPPSLTLASRPTSGVGMATAAAAAAAPRRMSGSGLLNVEAEAAAYGVDLRNSDGIRGNFLQGRGEERGGGGGGGGIPVGLGGGGIFGGGGGAGGILNGGNSLLSSNIVNNVTSTSSGLSMSTPATAVGGITGAGGGGDGAFRAKLAQLESTLETLTEALNEQKFSLIKQAHMYEVKLEQQQQQIEQLRRMVVDQSQQISALSAFGHASSNMSAYNSWM